MNVLPEPTTDWSCLVYGILVVIVEIPPGLVFIPILNVLESSIDRTSNNPLYPLLATPSVFSVLLTLLTSIPCPVDNLCGNWAVIIPTLELEFQVASTIVLSILRLDVDDITVESFL